MPAQALLYCEQIATVLLQQDPTSHPVLAQQLTKVSFVPLSYGSCMGMLLGACWFGDFTWVPILISVFCAIKGRSCSETKDFGVWISPSHLRQVLVVPMFLHPNVPGCMPSPMTTPLCGQVDAAVLQELPPAPKLGAAHCSPPAASQKPIYCLTASQICRSAGDNAPPGRKHFHLKNQCIHTHSCL